MLVSVGMGLMFVPLTLMVVSHVRHDEAGGASSLLNIGQQVGGSIGEAGGGAQAASRAAQAASGAASLPPAILYHALTVGFSTGLMIAGFVAMSGFVVALVTTWTPGRFRLRSARHDRTPSCDEVLGTCEPAVAIEAKA